MATKTIKKQSNTEVSFTQEYEKIMKTSEKTVIVDTQWSSKGDYFKKVSMYENYTPVKTTGNTTLNSSL